MNSKQSRLFRRLIALTAHMSPGSSDQRYKELKRKWDSTPSNERGLIAEGIRNTIANLEKGVAPTD